MIKEINVVLSPQEALNGDFLKSIAAQESNCQIASVTHIQAIKKSIDARGGKVRVNLKLKVFIISFN